jgi:hypothetical protein
MTSPSFRDIENLSAYLDGHLPQSEKARLEKRLQSEADLSAALKELLHTRAILQRVPQRRVPRNFTLTPKMAGIKPPVPRIVPVFSWASAIAMLLFIFTLGTSLVGQLSLGAAAPKMAAAQNGFGGGPPAASTLAPALAAPAPASQAPLATDQTELATPTPEASIMSVPAATPPPGGRAIQPSVITKSQHKPLSVWVEVWPGLGLLLGALAWFVNWLNRRSFQRKNFPK